MPSGPRTSLHRLSLEAKIGPERLCFVRGAEECDHCASALAAGPAVLVGRGAQFFLPRRHGFAVRVVADERDRVERIVARYRVSKTEARRIMIETHDRRAAFVRGYFHKDLDDPAHYDLVVNTSRLTVETAADLVAAAFHARRIGMEVTG